MWWGHHCGFGFFPFIFPVCFFMFVALCFIVGRMIFCRRRRDCGGPMSGPWNKDENHEVILKQRLANGDITEEEYARLRDILQG